MDNGTDHLEMPQFFCTNIRQQALQLVKGHTVALGQVAQGSTQFSVGAAVLGDDDGGQLGIRIADPDGILKLFVIKEHGYASLFWQYSQGHGSSSQS